MPITAAVQPVLAIAAPEFGSLLKPNVHVRYKFNKYWVNRLLNRLSWLEGFGSVVDFKAIVYVLQ